MLVLARKQNETIVIQNEIEIQVLKVQGKTVRLGIKAPKDVRIVRGELDPLPENEPQKTSRYGSSAPVSGPIPSESEGRSGLAKYIKDHPASKRNRQVTLRNLPFGDKKQSSPKEEQEHESYILELPISALKIQAN